MNLFTDGQADRMLALFGPSGIRESFEDCPLLVNLCEDPPCITGPEVVCQGSGYNFTLNDVPAGNIVEWEATPTGLFSTSTGTGVTASLSANSSFSSGSGQMAFHSMKTTNKFTITITGLESGMYIVRVVDGHSVYTGMLRVEK